MNNIDRMIKGMENKYCTYTFWGYYRDSPKLQRISFIFEDNDHRAIYTAYKILTNVTTMHKRTPDGVNHKIDIG